MTRSEELFKPCSADSGRRQQSGPALYGAIGGKSPDLSTMQTDAIFMMQMETDILITLIPGVP